MTNAARPHRIDVHHHFLAPNYVRGIPGGRAPFEWSPEQSLADMDKAGVATAVLSVTTPGVWFNDSEQARRLSRESNEYAARLVQDHPGRFGSFAALPLPDTEGSLKEIEYALDTLKADGIGLFTSYEDTWLGDPAFDAVFDELNRRGAVVYVHPIAPACCRNLVPEINDAVIEYATDTTRAIARMVYSGTAPRCPNIRFIWSHAGGTMPFLVERLTRAGRSRTIAPRLPNGVLPELQRFYYDVAQAAHPMAMGALRQVVSMSQILFGTDFPYRLCTEYPEMLAECGFSEADMRAIDRENALRLLPRLA